MSVYADTSFFVSLYLNDAHSASARKQLVDQPRLWLTPLHRAEWAHAITLHVFRKLISTREASMVFRDFERDRSAGLWLEIPIPETAFEKCIDLARRRTPKLGTRTMDTLHVASALLLGAQDFWTFDDRQATLALAEGLSIQHRGL